jgi:hypothetical protein
MFWDPGQEHNIGGDLNELQGAIIIGALHEHVDRDRHVGL